MAAGRTPGPRIALRSLPADIISDEHGRCFYTSDGGQVCYYDSESGKLVETGKYIP